MSLEGREGGREGGRLGREGEGGRGGMTVIHILMAPQYLNNNHVTYYVITLRKSTLDCATPSARRTMVRNYVRRDVDRVPHK